MLCFSCMRCVLCVCVNFEVATGDLGSTFLCDCGKPDFRKSVRRAMDMSDAVCDDGLPTCNAGCFLLHFGLSSFLSVAVAVGTYIFKSLPSWWAGGNVYWGSFRVCYALFLWLVCFCGLSVFFFVFIALGLSVFHVSFFLCSRCCILPLHKKLL